MSYQPIGVIVDLDTPRDGDDDLPTYAAPFIGEVLRHAGISFDTLRPDALATDLSAYTLVMLVQDLRLTEDQREGAATFVRGGGTLIATAGTSGLDALFGCETQGRLAGGYLTVPGLPHPVTDGMRRDVHVFGGSHVRATKGTALAGVEIADGETSDAIIEHSVGRGRTLLFAPDLMTSVVHIQQGMEVVPAPPREGSFLSLAACVLDWERDRDEVEIDKIDDLFYSGAQRGADGLPVYERRNFLEPMADALRELLVRAVFYTFNRAGQPLPVLWYWPRGLTAIGHLSHDSDGQRVGQAWSLFHLLNELEIRTTWCVMPVPGWTRDFFNALKQNDHEIGLHYAYGMSPVRGDRRWSQKDFEWQVDTLRYMAQVPRIISNKNHGAGWQGRLEFYRWCEEKGVQIDGSRGDKGFIAGSQHPFFPMEDQRPGGSFTDVLSLNFLTQELTVVCPLGFMRPWVNNVYATYGVAHFVNHPSHVEDPQDERGIRETVAYVRSLGMEWWKSDEINAWERSRRRLSISQTQPAPSRTHHSYRVHSPGELPDATLLFLMPDGSAVGSIKLDGRAIPWTSIERYGHRFAQVTSDLSGDHDIVIGP